MTGPDRLPPADLGLRLDPAARRLDGGRVLVGGAPLRLLRLTAAGAETVGRWAEGAPVGAAPAARRLARRLLDGGLAHPVPPAAAPDAAGDVAVVVPVADDTEGLARLLSSPGLAGAGAVVVVDDASRDRQAVADAVAAARRAGIPADLVRLDRRGGPGAARTAGVAATGLPVLAFVDADCVPEPGWLAALLAHFHDPAVAAAAPRVRPAARERGRWAELALAYERSRSPLDLGPCPGPVRPGGRVPYVPTAALVVRRAAYDDVGGFDPALRTGEDVDFVWRLGEAGWTVRYEPGVVARHDVRARPGAWLAQRVRYGRSAAGLHRRHGRAVAPLRASAWSVASWGLVAAGWPTPATGLAGGLAVAVGTTAALAPRLEALEHPAAEALALAGRGHLAAGRLVADALRRVWWPLVLVGALGSRRVRRAAAVAAVVPPVAEWLAPGPGRARPEQGLVTWLTLRLADDLAYGAGVWLGCVAAGTAGPLRPDLSSWPGRGPAVAEVP